MLPILPRFTRRRLVSLARLWARRGSRTSTIGAFVVSVRWAAGRLSLFVFQNMIFKEAAIKVLEEAGKPLHYRVITRQAIERGFITGDAKTPWATMRVKIANDIKKSREKSKFISFGRGIFGLQTQHAERTSMSETLYPEEIEEEPEKEFKKLDTKTKGDIAEARIAELIMLYGDKDLVCYKPISDVEGIDLIVKEKYSLRTLFIQIKSRFQFSGTSMTFAPKVSTVIDNHKMALVFCYFDLKAGDLYPKLWFIPAPDFIEGAGKIPAEQTGDIERYRFVGSLSGKETNKFNEHLVDKKDLANAILKQLDRAY